MKAVYYLNILLLLLCWSFNLVLAGTISRYADSVYKRYLMSRSLPFEDCGSRYLILYLSISSCNTIPCVMYRGSTVQVNVLFDDDGTNTTYLKHEVHWIFNAIKTYANISPDPCDGDHECISNETDGKTYYAVVHVNNTLPMVRGTMMWQAVNEYNQDVICFKVPVYIELPQ
ncbi:uncharacterized protein LOC101895135 [Musca domestica]|uniref:Uncharacterized protein LOC101895135 n=1 Tax=Musca domestica TaxID=7370 RepID=A0A9J7I0D6_MUSDO|nr:uncharacterized protein LOC101895135 [Musca domestica]